MPLFALLVVGTLASAQLWNPRVELWKRQEPAQACNGSNSVQCDSLHCCPAVGDSSPSCTFTPQRGQWECFPNSCPECVRRAAPPIALLMPRSSYQFCGDNHCCAPGTTCTESESCELVCTEPTFLCGAYARTPASYADDVCCSWHALLRPRA